MHILVTVEKEFAWQNVEAYIWPLHQFILTADDLDQSYITSTWKKGLL